MSPDSSHGLVDEQLGVEIGGVSDEFASVRPDALKEVLDVEDGTFLGRHTLLHECREVIGHGSHLEHFLQESLHHGGRVTRLFIFVAVGQQVVERLVVLAEICYHVQLGRQA